MHIRCERCSTVYELDERILPAGGAPVQCSRCRQVFQAYPPAVSGKTLRVLPAFQDAVGPAAAPASTPVVAHPAAAPRQPPATPEPGAMPDRLPNSAPPARATAGSDQTADPAAFLARRIRSRRMWRWLGPLLLLVAAGATGGGLWQGSHRISPEALARRQEGLRLLAGDDSRSLERAAEVLADAVRLDPRLFQARADRALALTLLAADDRERVAALEAGFRALNAERLRLEAEGGEGWQGRQADVIERMKAVEEQIAPPRDRAARLAEAAFADLGVLGRSHGDDPAVARALAMHYVLDGDVEQASKVVRDVRTARLSDPWLDLAEAAEDVVGANSRLARERAVARLAPLAAAHPDLLRARMVLARAQADLGHGNAAVATLDGVLEANGAHEGARQAKERLLEPPAAEPLRPRVPQRAPPAGRPGRLPRKPEAAAP